MSSPQHQTTPPPALSSWIIEPPVVDGLRFAGARLVHVNATATGGGVAELIHRLVPAHAAAGIAAGWAVIDGPAEFFAQTKAIHHLLHGHGDPRALDVPGSAARYSEVTEQEARRLLAQLQDDDVVVLHDPQTLGLAGTLADAGHRVIWHCHVGTARADAPGPRAVWRMLAEPLSHVSAVMITRREYAPAGVDATRLHVAPPAIDLTAPKCEPLSRDAVAAWLSAAGLAAPAGATATVADGLPLARVIHDASLPQDACVVLQVGRWDPLKDPVGVIAAMAWMPPDAHLVLAGPDPREVPDDPEGVAVLEAVVAARAAAPADRRARIHLVVASLRSRDDNARLVNALQRRADVVLQKSLEEGFGLTVTEAMAKGRAVVASAVGGIPDQIEDGRTGLLVDPTDLPAVGHAVTRLLADSALRAACGARAEIAAVRRFSLPRLVADYDRICQATNVRAAN